jgi:hypothetical protein
MTEKKEFHQEELRVAFDRLNKNDDLQPSAELDAMILQMAADEVQVASIEDEKSNVTDISDISFRRGQREAHTSLKKKGLFPNWVMPMGLAATVLLSFGVVNRVLLSPEFDGLTKQSSYEALSDEVIVTSAAESKVRAEKDASSLKGPLQPVNAQKKRLESDNAKATVTVNGNEMNADISFADAPIQEPIATSPPALDSVTMPSSVPAEEIRVNREIKEVLEVPVAEFEAPPQLGKENQELDSRQEQHALLAKEKRERLTQARSSASVEPEIQMASTAGFSVAEPVPQVSRTVSSVGNIDAAEVADSEIIVAAAPSIGAVESYDEVVVTGARLKNNNVESDSGIQSRDDLDALSDKGVGIESEVLQSVLFEHKQCQVKQDCALIALACDSCDCLESVNNEHYTQYQSEFNQSEIAEQCINTTVECVRNYCQVQQFD